MRILTMTFSKFLGISTIALSFCLATQTLSPVYAQTTSFEFISESKSALEGTRACLSDFDSKLEFPMSTKEKEESQKQLNNFRAAFSITKSKSISAKLVSTKAQETLQTARQAAKEAESGDRSKALKLFTQSRIKLYETKRYLTALETQPSFPSKTLSGRAQKADELKNARLVSQSPSSASTSNTTRININPNGIKVDERTAQGRTQVDVNPSGININEDGNRTAISVSPYPTNNQTPISVSPTGVRVGAPGGPSAVSINPSGIQVGGSGQPGSGGINIGADGIRIGGLGQTVGDIVRGSVGAALSTAGIQTQTGTNSNTVNIGGHDNVRTIRLNGQNLNITGHNNKINVIGTCGIVNVSGHDNVATIEIVNAINVNGHDNSVFFKSGFNGRQPQLSTLGRRNQISRIQ